VPVVNANNNFLQVFCGEVYLHYSENRYGLAPIFGKRNNKRTRRVAFIPLELLLYIEVTGNYGLGQQIRDTGFSVVGDYICPQVQLALLVQIQMFKLAFRPWLCQ